MFFTLSLCSVSPQAAPVEREKRDQKVFCATLSLDIILGVALLAIGLSATLGEFLPNHISYALLGAGATYAFGTLCVLGTIIKIAKRS